MNFLIILVATAILQLFAPWWTIALVPALVHLWRPTSYEFSFFSSFLAIGLLWLSYGLYIQISSDGAMSDRIAQIFSLPNGYFMLAISTLVGAITAGVSGAAGYSVRSFLRKKIS